MTTFFRHEPAPDHPGWMTWEATDPGLYNGLFGRMLVRAHDGGAIVRMTPERRHANLQDMVHGGALLGFIDVALFAASHVLGVLTAGTAVTIDLSTQFVGAGRLGAPLDAEVELLRETGRLLFLRGLVVQAGSTVASFSGTIRKPSP